MSTMSRWVVCVLVFAIGLSCGLSVQRPVTAQDKGQPQGNGQVASAKWEYHILVWSMSVDTPDKFEAKLNKQCEEGFEVVSVMTAPPAYAQIVYTLKRLKKN